MGMERTKIDTAVDEAALLAVIASEATAAGWMVVSSGTTPVGSYWFKSPGECGYLNIVGGFVEDTVARIYGFTAADLDTFSLVSVLVGGYVNEDPTGPATPVQARTSNSATYLMRTRKPGAEYRYRMSIDLDAIRVLVDYEDIGSLRAQAILYLGTEDPAGEELETQAKTKIASVLLPGPVGALAGVSSVQFTFTDNITAALKDTGPAPAPSFPTDSAQQRLFFQPVADGIMPLADAFQTERSLPIVPNSLKTPGGVTQVEIPLATVVGTSKLFQLGSGQRYDAGRGVGDLVRLYAQRTMCWVSGNNNGGGRPWSASSVEIIAAWDVGGGQRGGTNGLGVRLDNRIGGIEAWDDPDTLTLRDGYYRMYCMSPAAELETSILPSTEEASKASGAIVGVIIVVDRSQDNFSIYQIDGDSNNRWCMMERVAGIGMGTPNSTNIADGVWAIGRGF